VRAAPVSRGIKDDSFLKVVKYGAIGVAALMLVGIGSLMFISYGTGEDITGIVAPALLVTIVSSVVAMVAAVLQRRARRRGERAR
jgi:spore maturation protein SpmA